MGNCCIIVKQVSKGSNYFTFHNNLTVEMCKGMGTIGIPWDSCGNGSDNDYIMGMGVGIKVWEWE